MSNERKEKLLCFVLGLMGGVVLMMVAVAISTPKLKAEVPIVPRAGTTPTPVRSSISLTDSQSRIDVYNRYMLRNCLQELQGIKEVSVNGK